MENQHTSISIDQVKNAIIWACNKTESNHEYLTQLDQAIGDGDLGITMKKIAVALRELVETTDLDDIGQLLVSAGLNANRVGSSSFGTLTSTALMRAGTGVKGKNNLSASDLVNMLFSAANGIQERGKAQLGDKTVLDVLFPAAHAFQAAIESDLNVIDAGKKMLESAEEGCDAVTPQQSRIGRASWLGEQTKGKIDPGCAVTLIILRAIFDSAEADI